MKITGYTYYIEWSEKDDFYVAYSPDFPSLKVHGIGVEEALKEIKIVIKEATGEYI